MKKFLNGMLLISLVGFFTTVVASELKIAVVDYQKILKNSKQVVDVNNKMKNKFQPKHDKIVVIQKNLDDLESKYKRDVTVMKAQDKTTLEKNITKTEAELTQLMQTYEKDLFNAQKTAMRDVIAQLNSAVAKIAKKEEISLVILREAAPYFDGSLDITDAVAKIVN